MKVGRPLAVIDIGSNSVRLVAYEGTTRAPTPIYNEKVLCALGRHVATTGWLDEDGMARAIAALKRFRILCRTMDVGEVRVLATAAARDAGNGPAFLAAASEAVGLDIELLSGAREAALSALGVISGFYGGDGIVGDLGGGSLELIDVRGGLAGTGVTLPIGGLALLDLSGDSPRKAQRIVREALEGVAQLKAMRGRTFYAVGGTWRALARLHMAERNYPLRVMHGYRLPPEDGIDFLKMVERTDAAVLKEIEAVSEARRPLLAYGAIVLEEIIRLGKPRDIAISALGVREGLLYERLSDAQKAQDPLLAAAQEFNVLRSRSPAHNAELIAWTDHFFESARLEETAEERRLRHAACLLADIGWRAHPDYRGDQSVNLIANANFIGIDHPGRAFLSLAVFFRHEGLGGDKASPTLLRLAGPRLAERARLLGGAMRVAYPVSVAMAGILPRVPLEARGSELVLDLPEDLAELAGERLVGRMRQLAKITGRDPRILIG
ncbi:exopolyphosphatase [Salinarimonas soli]|uniref:exopolyphosphatase n=1 Tax=Salinarimonas soli TaxID=1638099 RepID=A0A5B2VB21_9HYPH|nr:exopolyphosphatase [Salinarimonas soli]KAA2235397.1 exopolyphosphatase [Salinarimonas soli]